jgi:hypothetical protein
MSGVQILDWRPMRKNSLLGFVRVRPASGMIVSDMTVLIGERGPWASPPSEPMIDRDGVAMKRANGKLRYSPTIQFATKEIRNKFSDAVIAALRAAHPEAQS